MSHPSGLKITTDRNNAHSVSILQSKKQIQDLEFFLDNLSQNNPVSQSKNRQISSSIIVDWKQFKECDTAKNQLVIKDTENNQKTIFSYLIEEYKDEEPAKVMYRWVKKPSHTQNQHPFLTEEEHIYRGSMKKFKKEGQGQYIILKRYSDNSQKIKKIQGEWVSDVLQKGIITDQNGKEDTITSNCLKLNPKTNRLITPYLDKNPTIEMMRKKSLTPSAAEFSEPSLPVDEDFK